MSQLVQEILSQYLPSLCFVRYKGSNTPAAGSVDNSDLKKFLDVPYQY